MKSSFIVSAVTAAALLAGCQTGQGGVAGTGMGTGQTLGTVGGAVAGGLIGSQIGSGTGNLVATGAGVALGALLGNQLGAAFDANEQAQANSAAQSAFNSGRPVSWSGGSGGQGVISPQGGTFIQDGKQCRRFNQSYTKDGRTQSGGGVACRGQDGNWYIVQ